MFFVPLLFLNKFYTKHLGLVSVNICRKEIFFHKVKKLYNIMRTFIKHEASAVNLRKERKGYNQHI